MADETPLEMKTIKLFKGDTARLRELYPKAGASRIIRELIRAHIRKCEEEASRNAVTVPEVNVDLP